MGILDFLSNSEINDHQLKQTLLKKEDIPLCKDQISIPFELSVLQLFSYLGINKKSSLSYLIRLHF